MTPAEIEQLVGKPFHPNDRLVYRFTSIANAALMKAACFTFLMLPDLRIWYCGFLGVFLGRIVVPEYCFLV